MILAKKTTIAIVIFVMLSMSASLILVPNINAHTPAWEIPTYAYIWAVPNPVGSGQTVSVFLFLTNFYYGSSVAQNDIKFHNFKLTITAPDGDVTEQNFPVIQDPTSSQHTSFVPDQVGTYILNFTYPGETYKTAASSTYAAYVNDTFMPSKASTTVTVQEQPIAWPSYGAPLPTEYWARPIYGENTDWWAISSNWLGQSAPNYGGYSNRGDAANGQANGLAMFPGDAIGPQTSHVMWTKPLQNGGVVGGGNFAVQGETYFDGSAYLIRYNNPIILDGMLYFTEPRSFSSTGYSFGGFGSGYGPTDCVDLRTGRLIWSRTDVPPISMGLIMNVETVNEHGVCPPVLISISGGIWRGFDAFTGDPLFNVTSPPAMDSRKAMGPDGEYLVYVFANAGDSTDFDWRLAQWNSTKILVTGAAPSMTGVKDGSTWSGTNNRYDWNISLPWLNTMPPSTPPLAQNAQSLTTNPFATFTVKANTTVTVVAAKYGDGILCYNGTLPSHGENQLFSYISSAPYTYFFINLNATKGPIGSVLWWKTLQPPTINYTVVQEGVDWETRMFFQSYKEGIQWVAYNLDSGDHEWTSQPQAALDYYGSPSAGVLSGQIAYGKLYSSGMSGILYCYDDKTGELLWTYGNGLNSGNTTNSGFNWPYGNIPTFINAVGNGVVYLITSEHTWTTPIYKGGLARAINATDGTEIWTISSVTMEFGGTSYAIADGFATWFNGYDNQIYVVGRGPSAITATAPNIASPFGAPVVIRGTVRDISSGTAQDEQRVRFPDGVPCSSDASMKEWMGYVYQQQPLPANFTGVQVTLAVIDQNNNQRPIGTTTTDATGMYTYTWIPDIPGDYKVIATFQGTNGYWPSSTETSFNVMSTQPTATPVASPPVSIADMYFIPAITGLFVLIIVIGAIMIFMLAKRPK